MGMRSGGGVLGGFCGIAGMIVWACRWDGMV